MTVRIAVVPYVADGSADTGPSAEVLMRVAAALQTQILRDVAPIWDVSAVVSPFMSLERVPPGHYPLITVVGAKLPLNRQGLHFITGGQPAAVITYGDGWSVNASHELIELVCDPWGTNTALARSLGDAMKHAGAPALPSDYQLQGQVQYLMEICDPCENSTYTIDGIAVSDFVTPAFYGLPSARTGLYSFTGRCAEPFHLLEGGYITWRAQQPKDGVWQALAPDGVGDRGGAKGLQIQRLGDVPLRFSRPWVDAHHDSIRTKHPPPSKPHRVTADYETARRYGAALRHELELILKPPHFGIDLDDADTVTALQAYGRLPRW